MKVNLIAQFRSGCSGLSIFQNLMLAALLGLAAGVISVSHGTDANFDLRNYQIYTAYAYFEGRYFQDIAPAQLQTYLPPFLNLIPYLLVRHMNDAPRVVSFVLGLPAGPAAFVLFHIALQTTRLCFGQRSRSWVIAALATLVGVTGSSFLPQIGTSGQDITVGLFVSAALAVVLREIEQRRGDLWLLFAGALAGIALAGKLTAAIYVAPLGMAVLILLGLRAAALFGCVAAGVFLAIWGPFGFEMWRHTGNPLFPLYNGLFRSSDWLPVSSSDQRFTAKTLIDILLYPVYWADPRRQLWELPVQDLRVALLWSAAWLAVGVILARQILRYGSRSYNVLDTERRVALRRVSVAFWLFVVLAYLLWAVLFGIYRYVVVIEMLSGVGLILILATVARLRQCLTAGALVAVLIITNLVVIRPDWGHVPSGVRVLDLPVLPIPSSSLVIFADGSAQGYLAPFLPKPLRFLGINNNLVKPQQEYGLNRKIAAVIAAHNGPIAIISGAATPASEIEGAIGTYQLIARDCVIIITNLDQSGHKICQGFRE